MTHSFQKDVGACPGPWLGSARAPRPGFQWIMWGLFEL